MKIRFVTKDKYYLVIDVPSGTARLMAYNQMPHTLDKVTKEAAVLSFKIEDTCLDYAFDPTNAGLVEDLRALLHKYSPDEKWGFHSRSPA